MLSVIHPLANSFLTTGPTLTSASTEQSRAVVRYGDHGASGDEMFEILLRLLF